MEGRTQEGRCRSTKDLNDRHQFGCLAAVVWHRCFRLGAISSGDRDLHSSFGGFSVASALNAMKTANYQPCERVAYSGRAHLSELVFYW